MTSQTVPILLLGTDALLAAQPATPVQLAHACLCAGFANVIPASWGDEIVAAGVMRRLVRFGTAPAIQCSCPIVAHRLLSVSADLRPVLVPTVPPPVALARYVRALAEPTRTRITYVGACPGAVDDSIDIRMTPEALIAMLAERQIVLSEQPRVFESIIPPDRRRFRSQPGGVPTVDALWTDAGSRSLVEIEADDFVTEIAQHVLTGKPVLLDVAARLGCACVGALPGVAPHDARARVVALEPPRATSPVVDERAVVELDLPIPAAPRTPVDVVAITPTAPAPSVPLVPAPVVASPLPSPPPPPPPVHRMSPARGSVVIPDPRSVRSNTPVSVRPIVGPVPVARDGEGRSLPRAYVARRRSAPKGIPAVPTASVETVDAAAMENPHATPARPMTHATHVTQAVHSTPQPGLVAPQETESDATTGTSTARPVTLRQILLIAVGMLAMTIVISAIVTVVIVHATAP